MNNTNDTASGATTTRGTDERMLVIEGVDDDLGEHFGPGRRHEKRAMLGARWLGSGTSSFRRPGWLVKNAKVYGLLLFGR
tara:strand:- start:128 stop:367 length:240 start_codon:yes stop_codon:yes gene_type:complete